MRPFLIASTTTVLANPASQWEEKLPWTSLVWSACYPLLTALWWHWSPHWSFYSTQASGSVHLLFLWPIVPLLRERAPLTILFKIICPPIHSFPTLSMLLCFFPMHLLSFDTLFFYLYVCLFHLFPQTPTRLSAHEGWDIVCFAHPSIPRV